MTQATKAKGAGHACSSFSRRNFLILGGASITVLATYGVGAEAQELVSSSYVRKVVGRVSDLEQGVAATFYYPNDDIENILVMLDEEAGGGAGEGRNIVAFNTICPHQGGYMGVADFKRPQSVLGPCPLHLSTFDLTKHGMIVSGHAVESLPQIVLEIDGDEIVATGVMGLFYGYSQNPTGA